MLVPSAANWTVPVGVPAPGAVAVTVAVNVTLWPTMDGLRAEPTCVDVSAAFTVWPPERTAVLVVKSASPL